MLHIKMPSRAQQLMMARNILNYAVANPNPNKEQHRHSIYCLISQVEKLLGYTVQLPATLADIGLMTDDEFYAWSEKPSVKQESFVESDYIGLDNEPSPDEWHVWAKHFNLQDEDDIPF